MSKNIVPCGGFELDKNFLGINKDGELSLVSGSEGKAYQQLVTDGTGKATWEDKAFGNMNGVIVEAKEFDITSHGALLGEFTIVVGKTYTVIFDDVEYDCVCGLYRGDLPAVGSLDETFSDYPFLIMYDGVLFCMAKQEGTHTIGILGEYIKPLSDTYLPDSVAKTKTILFNATNDELNEAASHFKAGGLLYLAGRTVLRMSGSLASGGISFDTAEGTYEFTGGGEHKKYGSLTERPSSGDTAPGRFYLHSSTSGSSKQFKITVDDTGTISATEVTT